LRLKHFAPKCGRLAPPGTRSDPSPLGLIMTGSRVDPSLLVTVYQTSGGVSSWENHPWAHHLMHPSRPAGHCASFLYLSPSPIPWPDGLREQFLLQPPARSPRWSSLGIPLHSPPCRFLCHPQSLTPVMTGGLDLLWLPK
jgi:hypothetical protein